MGLGCKPVGKLGRVFKKLDNELAKMAAKQKKISLKVKSTEKDIDH